MRIADLIRPFQRVDDAPPQTLGRFIGWCLNGSWGMLWVAGLTSAAAGVMDVLTALLLGWVIDVTSTARPDTFWTDQVFLIASLFVFFMVLRPLIFGASAATNNVIVQPNLGPQVLGRLHRWTMGHSVRFFDDDFAGRIAQKQMQVSAAVTEIASEFINTICFALASLVGSVVLLVAIDWRIALLLLAWVLSYLAMIRWFMPRIRLRSKARANARSMLGGQVVDTITNIKTVKLFAHDAHEDRVALNAMAEFRERAVEFGYLSAWFRVALMTVGGAVPILLIGGTIWLWSLGQASTGDIAAAGAVSLRLSQMTGWVSFTLMAMYSSLGEVEDGMRTLTPPHELTDAPNATALVVTKGGIVFEDLTFTYGRVVGGVSNVSVTIAPGQKVGLVGASGAGKSTFVSLLLRLYDPSGGRVLIDGQSVAQVTQESLRRQIGMVTQDTSMFNRAARDNIRYGRPDASQAEVEDAAKKAEAHEFIQHLRDNNGRSGYDAFLGERGVKLSGGQRQRIALARTILKNAPILVLDEATSALDSEVEAAIQDALDIAMEGKTVLAIAHRLSTIARMDRIIVMDKGRIVEDGTHDSLLAAGGLYARYWNRQSGGFIGIMDAAE